MATPYLDGFYPSVQPLSPPASPSPVDGSAPPSRPRKRRPKPLTEDEEREQYLLQVAQDPRFSAAAGLAEPTAGPEPSAEPDPGAPLNYMGVHNRHNHLTAQLSHCRVVVGIDKLQLFVFGEWGQLDKADKERYCEDHRKRWQELVAAQTANSVREYSASVSVVGATLFPVGGHSIYGKLVPCPVSVEANGMRIALADPDRMRPGLPVAQVIIDSAALAKNGHHSMLRQAAAILKGVGIRMTRWTVRRVDVCADVLGADAASVIKLIHAGRWYVTRFKPDRGGLKDENVWGPAESLETWACGKSNNIRLQIYNKLLGFRREFDTSKRTDLVDAKWSAWVECWGCIPGRVTRIEFQVASDWLKGRFVDCRTVEEVIGRLDSIAEILFTEQFRMTVGAPDREHGNQQRAEVHPFWSMVVDAVKAADFGGEYGQLHVERVKRRYAVRSVQRVEQKFVDAVVQAAALSLPVEKLKELDNMPAWAQVAAEVAVRAAMENPEALRDKAIAYRNEWEAKGIAGKGGLPELSGWWLSERPCGVKAKVRFGVPDYHPLADDVRGLDDIPF